MNQDLLEMGEIDNIHKLTAKKLGITYEEAKSINFAWLYGDGKRQVLNVLGNMLWDLYVATLTNTEKHDNNKPFFDDIFLKWDIFDIDAKMINCEIKFSVHDGVAYCMFNDMKSVCKYIIGKYYQAKIDKISDHIDQIRARY